MSASATRGHRGVRALACAWGVALLSTLATPALGQSYDHFVRRADEAIGEGDLRGGISAATQAIQLDASRPEAYLRAGMALYRLGALDGAERFLRSAQSHATGADAELAEALLAAVRDRRLFDRHLLNAQAARGANRHAEAAEWTTNAWRLFPSRTDVALSAAQDWSTAGRCALAAPLARFVSSNGSPDEQRSAGDLLQSCQPSPGEASVGPTLDFHACPPGLLLDRIQRRCQCSRLLPRWNESTQQCTPCEGGRAWSGTSCECPAGTTETPRGCRCNAAGLVWSEARASCVPCGDHGAWDPAVCSCAPNTAWNGHECACPSDRPAYDRRSQRCAPRSECAAGAVCGCPGGQVWDGSACACPPDRHRWTGIACIPPPGENQ